MKKAIYKGTFITYLLGFIASVILTVEAYFLVVNEGLKGGVLIAVIVSLAIVQLMIQLVFFLHLDEEPKPRWNLVTMLFALLVLAIVVFGSLWIMGHLAYHHGIPEGQTIETYIQDEENIHTDH